MRHGLLAGAPCSYDVERRFNKLKGWRGIAMRTDKTARSDHAAITLAAALIWLENDLINTPYATRVWCRPT